jgi:hypothetical protein
MRKQVFGVLVFVLLAALVSFGQEPVVAEPETIPEGVEESAFHFGLGLEALGIIPFVSASARWQSIGADLAVGLDSDEVDVEGLSVTVSQLWYRANGKYYPPFSLFDGVLQSYLGAGVIGLYVNASAGGVSVTVSVTGFTAMVGAELSFGFLDIPITLHWAANMVVLADRGGFSWGGGIRWDF